MLTALLKTAVSALSASLSMTDDASDQQASRYPKRKRAEVKYYDEDMSSEDSDGDEELLVPVKRRKTTNSKPLPSEKIFPFLQLPPEIRNKIYLECLAGDLYKANTRSTLSQATPQPTVSSKPTETALYFRSRQKAYRRTTELTYADGTDETARLRRKHAKRMIRWNAQSIAMGRGPIPNQPTAEPEEIPAKLAVGLLGVCRQVRDEAQSVLYGQRFVFADTEALVNFLTDASAETAGALRHIEVRNWMQSRSRKTMAFLACSLMAAKGVTHLESLVINCEIGYFWDYSYRGGKAVERGIRVARKLYRDLYPWLEAVGREKGDMYAGMGVVKLQEENFGGGGHQARIAAEERESRDESYRKELRKLIRKG